MPRHEANGHARQVASALRGVMLQAATQNNGRFTPWSQFTLGARSDYELWLGKGVCHGLSIRFIALGGRRRRFIAEHNHDTLNVMGGLNTLHLDIGGVNMLGNSGEGPGAMHAFLAEQGYAKAGSERFGDFYEHGAAKRLGQYVGTSTYGYIIEIAAHTMACMSWPGKKVFFDPNAGFATFYRKTDLVAFCKQYFGHWFVRDTYAGGGHVVFKARRYAG